MYKNLLARLRPAAEEQDLFNSQCHAQRPEPVSPQLWEIGAHEQGCLALASASFDSLLVGELSGPKNVEVGPRVWLERHGEENGKGTPRPLFKGYEYLDSKSDSIVIP